MLASLSTHVVQSAIMGEKISVRMIGRWLTVHERRRACCKRSLTKGNPGVMEQFEEARAELTPGSDMSSGVSVLQSKSVALPTVDATPPVPDALSTTAPAPAAATEIPPLPDAPLPDAPLPRSEIRRQKIRDFVTHYRSGLPRWLWVLGWLVVGGAIVWVLIRLARKFEVQNSPPSIIVQAPAVTVNPVFTPDLQVKAPPLQPIVFTPQLTCECPSSTDSSSTKQTPEKMALVEAPRRDSDGRKPPKMITAGINELKTGSGGTVVAAPTLPLMQTPFETVPIPVSMPGSMTYSNFSGASI